MSKAKKKSSAKATQLPLAGLPESALQPHSAVKSVRKPVAQTAQSYSGEGATPLPGNVPDSGGKGVAQPLAGSPGGVASAMLQLDPQQQHAVAAGSYPLFVRGASGTGKTTLLVHRTLHLFEEGIAPQQILIVTPTRHKATRIDTLLRERQGRTALLPQVDTLAALALDLWHKQHGDLPVLLEKERAYALFYAVNSEHGSALCERAWEALCRANTFQVPLPKEWEEFAERYAQHKHAWNLVDTSDLVAFWSHQVQEVPMARQWSQVLVEDAHWYTVQELRLLCQLLPGSGEGFFAVGDVSQAPPATALCSLDAAPYFAESWPHLHTHSLFCNYRSATAIVAVLNACLTEQAPVAEEAASTEAAQALGQTHAEEKSGGIAEGGGKQAHGAHFSPAMAAGGHSAESAGAYHQHTADDDGDMFVFNDSARQAGVGVTLRETLFPLQAGRKETGVAHLIVAAHEQQESAWLAEQLARLLLPGAAQGLDETGFERKDSLLAKRLQYGVYAPEDIAIAVRNRAFAKSLCASLQHELQEAVLVREWKASAFCHDERLAYLLRLVGRMLGLVSMEVEPAALTCPDKVLVKGPLAIAAFFGESPPFGGDFWQSAPFRELVKIYDTCQGWAGVFTMLALYGPKGLSRQIPLVVPVLTYEEMAGHSCRIVFMPGLEDGFVPFAGESIFSGRLGKTNGFDLEGERRLFAAAMSRARDMVLFSCAKSRPHLGGIRLKPSRFFSAVPKKLLSTSVLVRQDNLKTEQLSLLLS